MQQVKVVEVKLPHCITRHAIETKREWSKARIAVCVGSGWARMLSFRLRSLYLF